MVKYQYRKKKDDPNSLVTAYKFEVYLVGTNAQDYCIGFVKASEAECKKAKEKYTEACVCALSKVVFDTYTGAAYIPTPIAFRVDLSLIHI